MLRHLPTHALEKRDVGQERRCGAKPWAIRHRIVGRRAVESVDIARKNNLPPLPSHRPLRERRGVNPHEQGEIQHVPPELARALLQALLAQTARQGPQMAMQHKPQNSAKPMANPLMETMSPDNRAIRMEMEDGRILTDFTPKIAEHMQVWSRDNEMAGEVDEVEPDSKAIKLARDATGQNHWIPMDLVVDVDADGLHLNRSLAEMRAEWTVEPPEG